MTTLTIGSKAPSIKGLDQDNKLIELDNYLGKKVALYFYPADNTSTCTVQGCNLRDNLALLQQQNIIVVGVSCDDVLSHKKFQNKFKLPFSLIADTDKKIVERYGVYGNKKLFGKEYLGIIRTTFLINEKSIITHIINKPDTKNHAQQILNFLKL